MANLKEDSAWVDGIYQLETSDPVEGGPDGVDNVQAKQLGSRTRYLKDRADATDKRVDAMGQTVAGLGTDKLPVAGGTLKGVLLGKLGAIAPNNPQGAGYGFDGDADSGMFSPKDGLVQIGAQGIAHFETRGTDTYVGPNVAGGNLVLVAGADGRAVVTSEGRMLIGSWNSDGVGRLQVSGSVRADGFVSDALDAGGAHFRARNGDYGAFLRNDGTNVYLLSTKKGDPSGQFNDYRPFAWNLATGYVTIDANGRGTTLGGVATIVGDAKIGIATNEGRAWIGPLNGYFYSNAVSVGWWSPTVGSFQYMVDDRSFRIDGKPVWHSGNVTPLDASKGGVMSGSVTFAAGQRLFLDEGSAAFPSIAFVNDGVPDTGLYHARDGVFGVTCNGVVTVTFAQEATYFQAPAAGPSPAAGDNSLRFATTAWVTAAIGTASIGQIVMEARTSTRAGYVKCDGSQYKRADYPALWAYAQASGALVSEAEYAGGRWGGFSTADGQTYFRVPDLRGEFLRCWSDGRGDVDAGRAIGSFQASQNQAHTHAASSSTVDDHAHNVWSGPNGWHEHGVNQTPHAHITWTGAVQVAGTAPGAGMGPYNGRVTQMWSDEAIANIGIAGNGTHDHAIAMDGAGKHAHTISVQADGGAEARPRNVALLAMIRAY
ncbi:phage tail protein [Burkholderia gladioli]|uniref:phage tail protein n=1 Tax=Burkholderia gladioli TaxID=28095 RepID=UPI001C250FBA|nr:phage tail protein [Burkholderia gladioli]MBU9175888.1 tail fiber protein [Burkholderia gladioli]